jgi:hypothetical protein
VFFLLRFEHDVIKVFSVSSVNIIVWFALALSFIILPVFPGM